jgi:hypothetical protein
VSNVNFRGADWYAGQAHYWGSCLAISKLTQVSLFNVLMTGHTNEGPYTTSGFGLTLTATSAVPGVVYNLDSCTFNNLGVGISYGAWIQGVAAVNCNFTGCAIGINAPVASGETQLSIANSQFNCVTGMICKRACDAAGRRSRYHPLAGAAIQTAGRRS